MTDAMPFSGGGVLLNVLGGLGMFLLGMGLMTETLRSLAGNRLRRVLLRFTRSPATGALVGALTTAVLQSSSATTVATVGFVSAGLLGFESSLGIIFGANVGSTGLGWLVALLGIELDLGRLMLPLVMVGACLRLLGRGRAAQVGLALAGGALLFVGIDILQNSLADQGLLLDPSSFDAGTVLGRLRILLVGLLATVITQSSGAGVATTLAALAAGALQLDQACALVIGMDVGTTITALIAAIGASLSARRTAAAHVGFNCFTALLAFSLLPPYLAVVGRLAPAGAGADFPFLLTLFHTGFNLLGVALMLPLTHRFARLIRRLVRARQERPADQLERLPQREEAEEALGRAAAAIRRTFLDLIGHLRSVLGRSRSDGGPARTVPLRTLQADLDRIELYLDAIHLDQLDPSAGRRLLHLLHALDHLQRLHERCEEEGDRGETVADAAALGEERDTLCEGLVQLERQVRTDQWEPAGESATALARELHRRVTPFRRQVMELEASGEVDATKGTALLEAMRWLRRVSQHLRRIGTHLAEGVLPES